MDSIVLAIGPNETERLTDLATSVIDIAAPTGAAVILLHVFTEEEFNNAISNLEYQFDNRPSPNHVAERHSSIKDTAERMEQQDIEYSIRGAVGEHSSLVLREANEQDADMVVVGGSKRSPTGKAMFGSTAQDILLNADCPVLFVKPAQ
jgi:nucleotide-binding universal stress UspA family protein